jgi:hypothetical protein
MKRQGYHSPAPAIDSAVDVSNKLRGKFNERTNRKAKLLWLKLRAGVLDAQTAAAVARDHAQAFARFDKAAAKKEAA